ncbi:MAG TPA: hypothetical protein VNI20_00145 [Fimbriimonadaceae bacterium]|nr:hypothetical protein [Fimbriimonadaceae bacterium]
MSATLRALYGALVGALAVLLIHPSSRPYVATGLPDPVGSSIGGEYETIRVRSGLPNVDSLTHAAQWVQMGMQRIFLGRSLSYEESLLLVEIVQNAADADSDNAFWRQSEAVFQRRIGNEQSAIKAWKTASLASRWDDYENDGLRETTGIDNEGGPGRLAWHLAYLKESEDDYAQRVISTFARQTLRGNNLSDMGLRLATLRNGRLMRDGSKTAEGGSLGAEQIDFAALATQDSVPRDRFATGVSPRTLLVARQSLATNAAFDEETRQEILTTFQSNDAWTAFVNVDDARRYSRALTLASILTCSLPGALIATGVVGGLVFLFGRALHKWRVLQLMLTAPWAQILGLAGGVTVYLMSGLVFPAIWATVSLASFGFRHRGQREAVPGGLGTSYYGTVLLLALTFSSVLTLLFVGDSRPGTLLFEAGGFSQGFVSNTFVLGSLSAVIASLALVAASVWGFIARVPAERLAGLTVAKFGTYVCLLCFGLGVVITPLSIAVDHKISDPLSKIFQNESAYYLTRSNVTR